MKEENPAKFEDLVATASQELRPIMEALVVMIRNIDSEACEVVRMGDKAITFGLGPKKMSEGYVYIMPQLKWVNLGFYKGADLEDPEGLLEGRGKKLRHIKIHSLEAVDSRGVRDLVGRALAERRSALGRDEKQL